jgi:hypothetical protein
MVTKELAFLNVNHGCAAIKNDKGDVMGFGHTRDMQRGTNLPAGCDLVRWAIAWAKANGYVLDNVDYETATIKEG